MSQQINLYDPALLRKREWLTATNVALASLALLVVMAGWTGWTRVRLSALEAEAATLAPQAKALQDQVAALGKDMAGRKPDARLEAELAQARTELAVRAEVADVLGKGLGPEAASFAEYLRGLARQTPSGLWLTGFSVGAGGGAMEIRGRLLDPALLAEYIRRLNGEKAFQGRAFSALKLIAGKPPTPAAAGAAAVASGPAYHEFILVPAAAAVPPAPTAAEGRR